MWDDLKTLKDNSVWQVPSFTANKQWAVTQPSEVHGDKIKQYGALGSNKSRYSGFF